MTRPTNSRRLSTTMALALLSATLVAAPGCQKKKKKPPPPPPPPVVVKEAPKPIDINGLIQEMKPDARVKFADGTAPVDRSLAEGVIRLADALAKGDSAKMRKLIDKPAQTVLGVLEEQGSWSDETKKIEQVRVIFISGGEDEHPDASTVGLAIQDPGGAYLLGWTLKRDGETWLASAATSPADFKPRASDFDSAWRMGGGLPSASTPDSSGESADAANPAKKDEPGAPAEEKPDGPRRKSTPAGPITIPGGPG